MAGRKPPVQQVWKGEFEWLQQKGKLRNLLIMWGEKPNKRDLCLMGKNSGCSQHQGAAEKSINRLRICSKEAWKRGHGFDIQGWHKFNGENREELIQTEEWGKGNWGLYLKPGAGEMWVAVTTLSCDPSPAHWPNSQEHPWHVCPAVKGLPFSSVPFTLESFLLSPI